MVSIVSLDWYQVPCPRYEIAEMVMGATVWVTCASNYFSDRRLQVVLSAYHYAPLYIPTNIPAIAQRSIHFPTFQPSAAIMASYLPTSVIIPTTLIPHHRSSFKCPSYPILFLLYPLFSSR